LPPDASTHFSWRTSRSWTVPRKVVRNVWTRSVSRAAAWSAFFYRQLETLSFPTERRGADLRPRRGSDPLPPCLSRRIGLVRDLPAQAGGMGGEGAPPAARMGFRSPPAAAAKPLPQLLHARETDTETRRHGRLRGVPGLQGKQNAITEVLRGGSHTSHDALNGPDMQLQTALDGWDRPRGRSRYGVEELHPSCIRSRAHKAPHRHDDVRQEQRDMLWNGSRGPCHV
jgi:hypothetical protein